MKHWKTAVLGAAFLLAAVLWLERAVPTAGWGLAFPVPGDAPSAPESPDRLRELGAAYLDPDGGKVLYLTFDAGYENGNVAIILDILKKHNAKGAFFILDNLIRRAPDLVKRMAEEGHAVCNHTKTHPDMTKIHDKALFENQLSTLEKAYFDLTGQAMEKVYRPPQGRFSEENLAYAKDLGYKTLFWSFAYADWDNAKQPSPDAAKEKILSHLHNGEVMLLHPTSATNAAILDEVLTAIEAEGYRIAPLDELWG